MPTATPLGSAIAFAWTPAAKVGAAIGVAAAFAWTAAAKVGAAAPAGRKPAGSLASEPTAELEDARPAGAVSAAPSAKDGPSTLKASASRRAATLCSSNAAQPGREPGPAELATTAQPQPSPAQPSPTQPHGNMCYLHFSIEKISHESYKPFGERSCAVLANRFIVRCVLHFA